jgi:polysaccharide biosynthesis/export protein
MNSNLLKKYRAASQNRVKNGTLFLLTVLVGLSCTPTKKVLYFNDLALADSSKISTAKIVFETPIQKNDQLWITVGGSNPQDLAVLNSASGFLNQMGGNVGGGSNSILGYLVESDGTIKVPYVGKVMAEGKSRIQLEAELAEKFSAYTKNPVVNVRYLNYNITVLGEVSRPGRFAMATERINIVEALGMAGDLTFLGKAQNILVIREENGVRNMARLNLLSADVFNSPYYYLKTNDIVYVEPVRAKFISRGGVPQYLGIVAVGLSLILTVINVTK